MIVRVEVLCCVLAILSLSTIGADLALRSARHNPYVLEPGATLMPISGLAAVRGSANVRVPERSSPCYLVRFVSPVCRFCNGEHRSRIDSLDTAVVRRGCQVYVISAQPEIPAEDLTLLQGRSVLVGVSQMTAQQWKFIGTPSFALADRNWNIRWSHAGALRDDDLLAATARARSLVR